MFIPKNSDGQKLGNLRKNSKKKKINFLHLINLPRTPLLVFAFVVFLFLCVFFFIYVGPTCPFISFISPFQSRNNLFCPGFNFFYHN